MKNKLINRNMILIAVSMMLVFVSCKDNEPTPTEQSAKVTIDIVKPTAGQVFYLGDTIHFHVMINADKEIHGFEVNATNLHNKTIVWTKHEHDHAKSYHVDGIWVNNVMNHTNVELTVDALLDDTGKKTMDIRTFHCMPMKKK